MLGAPKRNDNLGQTDPENQHGQDMMPGRNSSAYFLPLIWVSKPFA